jgi:hypothetical protein
MNLKPVEFIDAQGDSWLCRIDTSIIMEAGRDLDIKVGELGNIDKMNVGSMIGLLWYSVRYLARARNINKHDFYKIHITPPILPKALEAMGAALSEAFPTQEDQGEAPVPLEGNAPGKSVT